MASVRGDPKNIEGDMDTDHRQRHSVIGKLGDNLNRYGSGHQ